MTVLVENIPELIIYLLMAIGWAGFFILLWLMLNRKSKYYLPRSIPDAGQANFSKGISNEELLSVLTLETDNLVAVTDHKGKIIYLNESFQYTLGYNPLSKGTARSLFDFEGFD